jgi:hypothetical protein
MRPYVEPVRRALQVFAFDPMLGRTPDNRITLQVVNEALLPGPVGARVQVIDYDGAHRALYQPVDLDDASLLMNDGLDPSESDPRFHQQMVYAVTMKVLENFEEALGRRLAFKRQRPLRLYPHAFEGANAFYDPETVSVLFGFFRADEKDPGANLPGQAVFTCLSQDIIAHEVTHALVDRLRPHFLHDSNPDVLAFHEGFADIVAIFQHFTFRSILAATIQKTRGNLRSRTALGSLAQQFGYATGSGRALREAMEEDGKPDPTLYDRLTEPHERGSVLVAAVFDAFFNVYQSRIQDLVRIATAGTGRLPDGDLHPDLVNRIAAEASKTAKNVLNMCIRAFEYLPPVDVTFADYLRALITADYETVPADERGLRAAMIESFRSRGIRMPGIVSLAEESLLSEPPRAPLKLPFEPSQDALVVSARAFARGTRKIELTAQGGPPAEDMIKKWAGQLKEFAVANAETLGLDLSIDPKPDLDGFHTVFRVSPDGQLLVDLVARFVQRDSRVEKDPALGGARLLGGTTVIASADGNVRYVIAKPLTKKRREELEEFVADRDRDDAMMAWGGPGYRGQRMTLRNFARLHRGLVR